MEKKYKLTEESISFNGKTLYRIESVRDFGTIKKGDKGGFVETERNLSHEGNAWVSGNAIVCGYANVRVDEDYIVFKNWWDGHIYFTWTRSNNMWKAGRFYGTGEELIKKAYKDSEKSGREYERVVKYVESILLDEKK